MEKIYGERLKCSRFSYLIRELKVFTKRNNKKFIILTVYGFMKEDEKDEFWNGFEDKNKRI